MVKIGPTGEPVNQAGHHGSEATGPNTFGWARTTAIGSRAAAAVVSAVRVPGACWGSAAVLR